MCGCLFCDRRASTRACGSIRCALMDDKGRALCAIKVAMGAQQRAPVLRQTSRPATVRIRVRLPQTIGKASGGGHHDGTFRSPNPLLLLSLERRAGS
jgi:hypothetical protein